ncbi:hypothetical protein PGTUg99_006226 [Puccinia graminis f. sp. tritici]|uniref:Uncharacterized protein n=1 Tax=Puccinia graminis f. sp. tritici TaxID=56615 RepID=A0A5B0N9A6_PUCGR|nr:hypothetical protein PGTUg99_006226 [Puccinia graminis f. sp. tritici]
MDFHKFTAQDPRGEEGDVAGLSRFAVAGLSPPVSLTIERSCATRPPHTVKHTARASSSLSHGGPSDPRKSTTRSLSSLLLESTTT